MISQRKSTQVFLLFYTMVALSVFTSCQRFSQVRREEEPERTAPIQGVGVNAPGGPGAPRVVNPQNLEAMGMPKKKMLILNFWNDTPVKQEGLGRFSAHELKRGLALTQRVLFLNDSKGELNTEEFVGGDQIQVAQLIREGRKRGVAVLLVGRISKIVFRQQGDEIGMVRQKQAFASVGMEVKLFDVQAGREIMASSQLGEANKNTAVLLESNRLETPPFREELTRVAAREAVVQLIPDILQGLDKMAWQGKIAKTSGNKIYVNAGRASGLMGGDILKVLTPGEDVYDSGTGAYLGRSQGQLKGTLEVVDFVGTDGALTEVHTGGNFREGDLVQLY